MTTYNLDPAHSSVNFSVKHMMIAKVHGGFEKMSGQFQYDPKAVEASQVELTIETGSINTHDGQRDTHLRSADFFDAEKFPTITFRSTRFGKNHVQGDLTIHGVTKAVDLEVEPPSEEMKDPWGNMRIGVTGSTKIKRKEFGLNWNAALEAGGVLVGDDISITFDVQFVKAG